MSTMGETVFDETVQLTNIWLKSLMEKLDWDDHHLAYAALRVTLQALRDHLGVSEVAHLAAQLPMLVRGFYYEGWQPAGKPLKDRSEEGFFEQIGAGLHNRTNVDPELVARAVFAVLAERVSAGETANIQGSLPKHLKDLWAEDRRVVVSAVSQSQ